MAEEIVLAHTLRVEAASATEDFRASAVTQETTTGSLLPPVLLEKVFTSRNCSSQKKYRNEFRSMNEL